MGRADNKNMVSHMNKARIHRRASFDLRPYPAKPLRCTCTMRWTTVNTVRAV